MFLSLSVVIMSQCTHISKYVHLTSIQFLFVNFTSIKLGESFSFVFYWLKTTRIYYHTSFVFQLSGHGQLCPLLRVPPNTPEEIKVLAGGMISSGVQDSLPSSLLVGRIQFLAVRRLMSSATRGCPHSLPHGGLFLQIHQECSC